MALDKVTVHGLADNAVTSDKIGVDVIAAEDIAANAISVAEIQDAAVTHAKLHTDMDLTSKTVSLSDLDITSGQPRITFTDTGNPVGDKKFHIIPTATDGHLRFQALNDSGSGGGQVIEMRREERQVTGLALMNGTDKTFFSTANNTANYINNGGGLGIGTTTPSGKLHVVGGADANLYLKSDSSRSGVFIQTPGTNNITGSMLVLSSDTSFRLGTAAHYNIVMDQNGYVTLPRLPVCYGRLAGTGSQSSGYVSALTVEYDPLSMVSTANKRITVPVTGRYVIFASQLVDPVPTYTYLNVRRNGSTFYHAHNNMMSGSDNMDHQVTVLQNCTANDYIDFTYSGDITTLWASNHSFYAVYMIG